MTGGSNLLTLSPRLSLFQEHFSPCLAPPPSHQTKRPNDSNSLNSSASPTFLVDAFLHLSLVERFLVELSKVLLLLITVA